jgi:hypothetical protein
MFKTHLERHHNPRSHGLAAGASAVGATLFVVEGHLVIGAVVSILVLLNLVHAVNEYRHPIYGSKAAERHLRELRERIDREKGQESGGEPTEE